MPSSRQRAATSVRSNRLGFLGPSGEAGYAVQYIPRRDIDMTALARSDHTTYCPYKGEASYFSIPVGGERSTNEEVRGGPSR